MDHLAGGVDPGVRAPGGVDTDRLTAERRHRPFDLALHRRQIGLGLETLIGAAIVFHRQAIAGHQLSRWPLRNGNPRRNVSASWGARPSRWTRRMRTAPSPQAISNASSRTSPPSP